MTENTISIKEHTHGTVALLGLSKNSAQQLKEWCSANNLPCLDEQELHCTVLFSRNPVRQFEKLHGSRCKVHGFIIGWKKLGPALTLELYSPKACQLHEYMIKHGATHDYPSFIAHTSVTSEWQGDELPKDCPSHLLLEFDSLSITGIDPKYSEKNK